jgi:hypothetical protein
MGADILKVAGAVAGIGGIAIGTLLLLFREVIRKNIFSTLTKADSYRLMRWVLILVWSVALVGIVAYVYVEAIGRKIPILYQGAVSNAINRQPIRGASVVILGRQDISPQITDGNGNFLLRLETSTGAFQGKLRVIHPEYEIWEKPINLTRSTIDEVLLSEERLRDFELNGEVRDSRGAVSGARISVKDATTLSDQNGAFSLKVKGRRGETFELRVGKRGYRSWMEPGVEARSGILIHLEKN